MLPGLSAALSLATALGATFLIEDSTLRLILAVTLGLTGAANALTYWRHRRPGPLLVTALAAVWVYGGTYLVGGTHGRSSHADDMADHGSAHDRRAERRPCRPHLDGPCPVGRGPGLGPHSYPQPSIGDTS